MSFRQVAERSLHRSIRCSLPLQLPHGYPCLRVQARNHRFQCCHLRSDNNKYKFDCNIDHQSDVFQLGKVFWYILQGNAPIGNIRRSDFFDGHDDIYSVLKYMLNHSKKKRPISIDYVINELSRIMQKYKFVC